MKSSVVIQGDGKNIGRPASHPRKSNWKLSFLKKSLPILQHIAPGKVAKIIWQHFVRPGKARFSEAQSARSARPAKWTRALSTCSRPEHGLFTMLMNMWMQPMLQVRCLALVCWIAMTRGMHKQLPTVRKCLYSPQIRVEIWHASQNTPLYTP